MYHIGKHTEEFKSSAFRRHSGNKQGLFHEVSRQGEENTACLFCGKGREEVTAIFLNLGQLGIITPSFADNADIINEIIDKVKSGEVF